MTSYTPQSRAEEATSAAFTEGMINGFLTFVPSLGALYIAMQNEGFRMRTNWQSRTALVIMPALFTFALTSEQRLSHKMHEIASETKHGNETVKWAELQHQEKMQKMPQLTDKDAEMHLLQLYKESVENSGVSIVPGDQLGFHHKIANYAASNPIKILAALAIPSIATIFYGRTGKQHLEFSHMLLHTRVFGQFATLSLLLGVMGFKEFMDSNGKFITETEASRRVEGMRQVRQSLIDRLDYEKQQKANTQREIAEAHQKDLKDKQAKKFKKEREGVTAVSISS